MILAFSSTTVEFVSFFRSSQANQKSRLSSLYSERRNSRNTSRPSNERSIISKLRDHDSTSSRLGCLKSYDRRVWKWRSHTNTQYWHKNAKLEGRRLNLLFFCSFNTVHLGAGLSFTPLQPVFIPGLEKRNYYVCQKKTGHVSESCYRVIVWLNW